MGVALSPRTGSRAQESSGRLSTYQLTDRIIGAAIKIHRRLGPGLLESAYETCLAYELRKQGVSVSQQKAVQLVYDGVKLECGFRADLLVENRIVVELKCKDQIHPVDEAQLLSHLRLLDPMSVCSSISMWFCYGTGFGVWSTITANRKKARTAGSTSAEFAEVEDAWQALASSAAVLRTLCGLRFSARCCELRISWWPARNS
jgi:GxxExxY protein